MLREADEFYSRTLCMSLTAIERTKVKRPFVFVR